tara:strand:+ start:687 stop:1640 length:954 start_codon:yes stop_codon:yes gene_type:complete
LRKNSISFSYFLKLFIFTFYLLPIYAFANDSYYSGPIIDAHIHLENGHEAYIIEQMKKANVASVVTMAVPGKNTKLNSNYKDIFQLCDAEFVTPLSNKNFETAKYFSVRHKTNECFGFGEVGLRHYDKEKKRKRNKSQKTLIVDLDNMSILNYIKIADKQKKPIVFHIEPSFDVKKINRLEEVKEFYINVCSKFPNLKIIAAHTGMMDSKDLKDLFQKCENLYADFKIMHGPRGYEGFRDLYPIHSKGMKIFLDWKNLIYEFPDRFLLGTDFKPKKHKVKRNYFEAIQQIRSIFQEFPIHIQEKIFFKNAKFVYNIN